LSRGSLAGTPLAFFVHHFSLGEGSKQQRLLNAEGFLQL